MAGGQHKQLVVHTDDDPAKARERQRQKDAERGSFVQHSLDGERAV